MILVATSHASLSAPLARRLALSRTGAKSFRGPVGSKDVLLVETDPGPEGTMVALEGLPAGERPALAVAAGLAAAILPGIRAGDIVVDLRGVEAGWLKAAKEAVVEPKLPLHLGPLASVPAWGAPGWKAELAGRVRASAADVHSSLLRQWCERTATPFMAVMAILEERDEDVPADLPRTADALELARYAAGHPTAAGAAVRLWSRRDLASSRLALFLDRLFRLQS